MADCRRMSFPKPHGATPLSSRKYRVLWSLVAATNQESSNADRPKNGPAEGWLSMRASGRLRTIKPRISRGFSRLLMSCWMVPEVSGRGRWWAV